MDELENIRIGNTPTIKINSEQLNQLIGKDVYINKLKSKVLEVLNKYNVIFFDGFLFFDDIQYFIIQQAIKLNKEVYLISKSNILDQTEGIILQYYKTLFNIELSEIINFSKNFYLSKPTDSEHTSPENPKKWLVTVRNNFLKDTSFEKDQEDHSIIIYKPFSNREEELIFVIKKIGELIREKIDPEKEDLKNQINNILNEIAIVIGIEKDKHEEMIDALLRQYGVFLFDQKMMSEEELKTIDINSFNKIYYSKFDFFRTEIKKINGSELSFKEKLELFDKCFKRINVIKAKRPISSYPVAQFIIQLCELIVKGIDVDKFKIILFSNWKYFTDNSDKWSDYLFQFRIIQEYFRNSNDISEWIAITLRIKEEKKSLLNKYSGHPFLAVSDDFLNVMEDILLLLNEIKNKLKDEETSIKNFIEKIRDYLLDFDSDDILKVGDPETDFERKLILKISETLKEISISSFLTTDVEYFANNIINIIDEFKNEPEEFENDELYLNVENLENMHKFKYVFFVMAEDDKYPRPYRLEFPFSEEIIEIIENYKICEKPAHIHSLDYHLQLEKYLFKNVLDFTQERIYFTYSQREGDKELTHSIFIEDLISILGKEGKNIEEVALSPKYQPRINRSSINIDKNNIVICKGKFKEKIIRNEVVLYNYCKKLFFYKKLLSDGKHIAYFDTYQLGRFSSWFYFSSCLYEHSQIYSGKVYSIHDNEYCLDLINIMKNNEARLKSYFSLLNEKEFDDCIKFTKGYIYRLIKRIAQKKINNFNAMSVYDKYIITSIANEKSTIQIPLFSYLEFVIMLTIWEQNNPNDAKRIFDRYYNRQIDKNSIQDFSLKLSDISIPLLKCNACEIKNICKLDKVSWGVSD